MKFPSNVIVELSDVEYSVAQHAAQWMRDQSIKGGMLPNRNQDRTPEEILKHDVQGRVSEMCLSKLLGTWYGFPTNVFHAKPDVGRFDVRSVDDNTKGLIVRKNDHHERPFVLGHVWKNRCMFVGWKWGHEIAVPHNIWNPHGKSEIWIERIENLRPLNQLKEFGGDL